MAILPTGNADEEELLEQQQQQQGGPQLSSGLGGGAPGGGGAVTGDGGSGPTPAARRGGAPRVTLDQYLAANRGSVQRLGDQVTGLVTGAGDAARGAINDAQGAFNSQVSANEFTLRDDLIMRLNTDAAGLAGDQAAADQFTRMRDATYGGPRSLEETEGYSAIASRLADAREVGDLASNESGLGALSDRVVEGSRTTGGRALDSQLLRADTSLRERLDTARQGLGTLDSEVGAASQSAQERAQQAQATTAQTRDQTRSALVTAQDALQTQLDERVSQQRLEAFYRAMNAQEALRGYNTTPGYAAPPWQPGELDPGLKDLTPQDIAALQALPPEDLARLQQQRMAQVAQQQANTSRGALPTTGAEGRYYAGNDPTQGTFQDGAIAGNVPEFVHGGSGQAAIPGFEQYVSQNGVSRAPTQQELADLGITPQQWAQLAPLMSVVPLAKSAAAGTNNVNPYSFLEDYTSRVGDLSRFMHINNPNATIQRENSASSDDYARANALRSLAGDLGRTILDPTQADLAGTANLDLVSFDLGSANAQRDAAYDAIAQRAGVHLAGNARSGNDSFAKRYGFLVNPLDPRFAAYGGLNPVTLAATGVDYYNDPQNEDVDWGEDRR